MIRSTRMMWGMCWLLAVVPVVNGCDESPSAPGVEVASRDLDFVLPAVRGEPRVVAHEAGEWTEGPAGTELVADLAAARGDSKVERAYIQDKFVTAYWSDKKLIFEYGMVAYGTGYSMKPRMDIRAVDGPFAMSEVGNGISLNLGIIPTWFRPRMKEELVVGQECGLIANVSVAFTAFLGLKFDPFDLSFSSSIESRASASQPRCPAPPGSGGSGTGSGGGTIETPGGYNICYYEVWVDLDGNIVEVLLLGCHRVGGGLAT